MKIKSFTSLLLLFAFVIFKSQNLSPEEKKLDNAVKLLKGYNLDSAEIEFRNLIKPEIQKSHPNVYIRAQLNIGRIYGDKGDNVKALEHYQKALKTAESTNNKGLIPHVLKT